ncbi:MAG: hypothetical protein Q8O42_15990 [Acidobacteriota bacterium]|nr:hypothetical protein [Acidobacteriota bacterium]
MRRSYIAGRRAHQLNRPGRGPVAAQAEPLTCNRSLTEVRRIVESELGARLSKALAASELKLKVELIDEGATIAGLQKAANRITLGLILAAPIVGGSMIMRVETTVRIFGYPALAMLMLLLAGAGAAYLAIQIVRRDRTPKTR